MCTLPIENSKIVNLYMDFAQRVGEESYCNRRKVGAVVVDYSMSNIISFGYNGTISGFENNCELDDGTTNNRVVLHAETNALTKLLKSGVSSVGCVMFTTLSPCVDCAKLIIQSGIRCVIYKDEYHNLDGIKLLKEASVGVVKYEKD